MLITWDEPKGRVKFVGTMQGALFVVLIAAPLGTEAISMISLRRASRNERTSLNA